MNGSQLVQNFEIGAEQRRDEPAIWTAEGGRWISFAEVLESLRRWKNTLEGYQIRNRLVTVKIRSANELLPALLAIWSRGGVAMVIDESLRKEIEEGIIQRERPTICLHEKQIFSFENPRRFRFPNLLLAKLTSGTSGEPKVLYFTADQMVADAQAVTQAMGIGASDRNFAMIPLAHSYGMGNVLFPFLVDFVPFAQGDTFLPHGVASQIKSSQSTVFPGTPSIFRALCKTTGDLDLTSIRLFISAGSRLSPALAQSFQNRFGKRLHNFYGSTETGGIAFAGDETTLDSESAIGLPLPGVSIGIEPSGRLVVKSPAVFTYQNRRVEDGMGTFRLSDRGHLSDDGTLHLLDREVGVHKIGARRIFTDRLLRELTALPQVSDLFLTVINASGKDYLALAVETNEPLSSRWLRSHLSAKIPKSQIPRKILILSLFPRTPRGKTDREALRFRLAG